MAAQLRCVVLLCAHAVVARQQIHQDFLEQSSSSAATQRSIGFGTKRSSLKMSRRMLIAAGKK